MVSLHSRHITKSWARRICRSSTTETSLTLMGSDSTGMFSSCSQPFNCLSPMSRVASLWAMIIKSKATGKSAADFYLCRATANPGTEDLISLWFLWSRWDVPEWKNLCHGCRLRTLQAADSSHHIYLAVCVAVYLTSVLFTQAKATLQILLIKTTCKGTISVILLVVNNQNYQN